jgi:hypothetical protein
MTHLFVYGTHDKVRRKFLVRWVALRSIPGSPWDIMEVWTRAGCRRPAAGDTLEVFDDGGTLWALAPKKED